MVAALSFIPLTLIVKIPIRICFPIKAAPQCWKCLTKKVKLAITSKLSTCTTDRFRNPTIHTGKNKWSCGSVMLLDPWTSPWKAVLRPVGKWDSPHPTTERKWPDVLMLFRTGILCQVLLYVNENAGALARPPATCPPCHYSSHKVLLTRDIMMLRRDVMTSRRHVTAWRNMTQLWQMNLHMSTHLKLSKWRFST